MKRGPCATKDRGPVPSRPTAGRQPPTSSVGPAPARGLIALLPKRVSPVTYPGPRGVARLAPARGCPTCAFPWTSSRLDGDGLTHVVREERVIGTVAAEIRPQGCGAFVERWLTTRRPDVHAHNVRGTVTNEQRGREFVVTVVFRSIDSPANALT